MGLLQAGHRDPPFFTVLAEQVMHRGTDVFKAQEVASLAVTYA